MGRARESPDRASLTGCCLDLDLKEVRTEAQRTFGGRAFQLVGIACAKALTKGEPTLSQASKPRAAGAEQLGEGPREAGLDRAGLCKAFG